MTGEDENENFIVRAIEKSDTIGLLGSAAISLHRIAVAQEALVQLAQADIEATVEAEVQSRSETLATEIAEDKAKRSFIGKR